MPANGFSERRQRSTSPNQQQQREDYHRSQSRQAAQNLRDRFASPNFDSNESNYSRDSEGFRHPQRLTGGGGNNNNFRSAQSSLSRRRRNGEAVFSGLLSAPVSPFDPQTGRCDTSVIEEYAQMHRRDGVDGVFCNGTTGESQSLTVRERMDSAEAWVRTGLQVCVHVGTQSLLDTQKLARHAQDCGAHGIAVIIPFTVAKPNNIDAVVDYLEEVYKAAPEIPMLVYHFPTLTNIPFKLFDIFQRALARNSIPTLCGAKFTSFDLADFVACQNIGGQITDMIYSIEGNLVGAAFLGARAFVGMQFSMIAPIYRRVIDAARCGDPQRAQQENRRACDFIQKMGTVGTTLEKAVAVTKFVVAYRLRRDIGEPRPPGARLSADEKRTVSQILFPFFDRHDSHHNNNTNNSNSTFTSPSQAIRNSFGNNNNNEVPSNRNSFQGGTTGASPNFQEQQYNNNKYKLIM